MDRVVYASDVRAFSSLQSDRSDITCFRCGENGHRKSECMQWRTRLCWHFKHARCWKENCPFAHGPEELRAPWHLKCIRIVKVGNAFHDIGCGSLTHSFRNCPHADTARLHELLPEKERCNEPDDTSLSHKIPSLFQMASISSTSSVAAPLNTAGGVDETEA